jgi:type VI secretion system protein ImpA
VVIPAKEPEWQHVLELATGLSRQTQDLRVLLQITRALTHLRGLAGFEAGLHMLNSLLKQRWEYVHPQLVIDGLEDPQERFGVLSEFGSANGLVSDVRQATALNTPLGALTVRDLERIAEQGSVEINGVSISREQLDQMVLDLGQSEADALKLPGHLVQLLNEIRQGIEERSGTEFTPDLGPLMRPLERVSGLLREMVRAELSAEETGEPAASAGNALNVPVGALTSRAAAIKAMEAICAYLERYEPTSPVPLLIRRARRLMDMSFLDIVKDMSPDGVNQVLFIVGDSEEG